MPGLEPGLADSKSTVITNYTTRPILDSRTRTSDPGNYSPLLYQLSYIEVYRVGFEPTKHNASELESDPFDRSGICTYLIYKIKMIFKFIHDGIRTRNLQIRSLTRYPIAPHGLLINEIYI